MGIRRRERRLIITVVSGVVLLCLAVPAVLFYEGAGSFDIAPASRDAENAAKAYRAAGLPWTAKDLAPNPPLSPGENAAPLIKSAIAIWPVKDWNKALLAITDAGELKQFDAMERTLRPYNKALDLAAKASRMRGIDFHYDWDMGPSVLFPEFSPIKDFGRGLGFRARIAAAKGDLAGTLQNLQAQEKLADLAGSIPTLIGTLVRVAIQTQLYDNFALCAGSFRGNSAALEQLRKSFSAYDDREDLVRAMKGDAYMNLAVFRNLDMYGGVRGLQRALHPPIDPEDQEPPHPIDPAMLRRSGLPQGMMARAYTDRLMRYFAECASSLSRDTGYPKDYTRDFGAIEARYDHDVKATAQFDDLFRMDFKDDGRWVLRRMAMRNTRLALVTALEVEAKTGKMPTSISQIPGTWIDPYDGKPLRVVGDDKSIRIYSLGHGLVDHQGQDNLDGLSFDEANIVAVFPPRLSKHLREALKKGTVKK